MIKSALINTIFLINTVVLIRALLSWVVQDSKHPLMRAVYALTEPLFAPVRRILERVGLQGSTVDFSGVAVIFLLSSLSALIARW